MFGLFYTILHLFLFLYCLLLIKIFLYSLFTFANCLKWKTHSWQIAIKFHTKNFKISKSIHINAPVVWSSVHQPWLGSEALKMITEKNRSLNTKFWRRNAIRISLKLYKLHVLSLSVMLSGLELMNVIIYTDYSNSRQWCFIYFYVQLIYKCEHLQL